MKETKTAAQKFKSKAKSVQFKNKLKSTMGASSNSFKGTMDASDYKFGRLKVKDSAGTEVPTTKELEEPMPKTTKDYVTSPLYMKGEELDVSQSMKENIQRIMKKRLKTKSSAEK